jgi:hypothetical protein
VCALGHANGALQEGSKPAFFMSEATSAVVAPPALLRMTDDADAMDV